MNGAGNSLFGLFKYFSSLSFFAFLIFGGAGHFYGGIYVE